MRNTILKDKRQQISGEKRLHWGILTLADLDRTKWKHSRLITQLQAKHQASFERGSDKTHQESEDFSI